MLPTRRALTLIQGGLSVSVEADQTGRIVRDARGNAVWDWGLDTVVLASATTADLLRNLAPQRLSLELAADGSTAWAGDPYNRSR